MAGTVLCVDDDRTLCKILAEALGEAGYTVHTAFDGEQALEAVVSVAPDLVLLDLILPRRDGFAVLEALRAWEPPLCDTDVVILTGCSPTPEYRDRAAALGVQEMITKPIPLDRLLAIVSASLGELKSQVPAGNATARDPAAERASSLSGTLEQTPIPELLHHLHGLRATGVLHLSSGRKRKWIQLGDGYPLSVRSNLVNECLGNFLVRSGTLSQAALAESRRRMKPGRLQGEILVAMDLLSEDEIAAALRAQADEKLFEIFGWKSGSYRFEMGSRLQRANSLGLKQSPANLILLGVRERYPIERVEEYLRCHADCRLAHAESPFYRFQEVDLTPDQLELLGGLDGSRQLSEFLDADDDLKRTLFALLAVGLLEMRGGGVRGAPSETPRHAPPAPVESAAADDERRSRLMAIAERLRSQSYFEILGIDRDATLDETRAAFERLAAKMHPDQFSGSSQAVKALAEDVFTRINRAYETLADPRRRGEYVLDQQREQREANRREESHRALDAEKCFQQGQALLAQRSYERALVCFGKALELYPAGGEYHAHYGWTLHLCHPTESSIALEAIEHVRRGIKLAGHRETSYLFIGRLYKAIGRAGTAEKMFTRAVQIKPECVEALRELRLINLRREKSRGLIGRLFGR